MNCRMTKATEDEITTLEFLNTFKRFLHISATVFINFIFHEDFGDISSENLNVALLIVIQKLLTF